MSTNKKLWVLLVLLTLGGTFGYAAYKKRLQMTTLIHAKQGVFTTTSTQQKLTLLNVSPQISYTVGAKQGGGQALIDYLKDWKKPRKVDLVFTLRGKEHFSTRVLKLAHPIYDARRALLTFDVDALGAELPTTVLNEPVLYLVTRASPSRVEAAPQ